MAQNDKVKGVWLVKTSDGVVIAESSEVNALRTAVATGGTPKFVKYGDAFGSPSPSVAAAPQAVPTPEPAIEGQPENDEGF